MVSSIGELIYQLFVLFCILSNINIPYLARRGDCLLRPLCSNEFIALARGMIRLSKWANKKYDLPKDGFTARISWIEIFDISVTKRTASLPPFRVGHLVDWKYLCDVKSAFKSVVIDLLRGCRFNFRTLADFQLLGYLMGSFVLLMASRPMWGLLFLVSYFCIFIVIVTIFFVL
jgi:hypothetical protein